MKIGMGKDFTVKLTPKNGNAASSESLLNPFHMEESIFFELVLRRNIDMITILSIPKYANPIFAKRQPGKLSLLVHLRNSLTEN